MKLLILTNLFCHSLEINSIRSYEKEAILIAAHLMGSVGVNVFLTETPISFDPINPLKKIIFATLMRDLSIFWDNFQRCGRF